LSFDEQSAPLPVRGALAETRRRFGGIPEPVARQAASPSLLLQALSGLEAFEHTTLSPLEREVVAMTMSRRNGCQFCVKLHGRLLAKLQADAALVAALHSGDTLPDTRLEVLRRFVIALQEHTGDVPRDVWSAFREAGYTHEQALELVLGVGVYTITTLANRLTETSE
jgi:uncharacterized peroxidase-related enzyme